MPDVLDDFCSEGVENVNPALLLDFLSHSALRAPCGMKGRLRDQQPVNLPQGFLGEVRA
jgi:hypothetical protein